MKNRFLGCLLGLACGDAVGTSVEFEQRGSFSPITDMIGGGPFDLEPGEWTDDTSMALCLATSLIECNGFDPHDQMQRYCRWEDEGFLSSNGECFDIGNTVTHALNNFRATQYPFSGSTDPYSAGNGSIMRLAPIPMFYLSRMSDVIHYSAESSRTTHGAKEAVEACRLFGVMIAQALNGASKEDILFKNSKSFLLPPRIQTIAEGRYKDKTIDQIYGTGYVVQSLEAALWCFLHTETFEEAILKAVNLGDDADTTAAVCGQIAGAYYGYNTIPDSWLKKLAKIDMIEKIALKLYHVHLKDY